MSTIVKDSEPRGADAQPEVEAWDAEVANDGLDADFKPLTPEQAQAWRQRNPATSPWRVVWMQCLTGLLLAVMTAVFSGQQRLALSVAWGVVSVVLPAAVFARALGRQTQQKHAGAALAGLFVWELVKIVLTVVLLVLAPVVVKNLSWLALVAGFVVTMKVYWLAMALGWMRHKPQA